MKIKGYLANGLFGQADFLYNEKIASHLRSNVEGLKLFLPQENEAINDKSAYANSRMITRGDDEELLSSDFLVAVIDGVEIDSGVACEIGKLAGYDMAYQLFTGKPPRPIFALFTDSRQHGRDNNDKLVALIEEAVESQYIYRNLYVIGTIKDTNGNVSADLDSLSEAINEHFSLPEEE